jgi:hypothetical protein
VPEIIQSTPQDHPPPGKCHYLPDFRPVILAVAMNMAVLAGRFRIERALAPFLQGIGYENRTVPTKMRFLTVYILNRNPDLIIMLRPAVHPDKLDHHLEVPLLFAGELFHEGIINEIAREVNDTGQKKK